MQQTCMTITASILRMHLPSRQYDIIHVERMGPAVGDQLL